MNPWQLWKMAESGELSWEAKEVFQKIKSFNRLLGTSTAICSAEEPTSILPADAVWLDEDGAAER